MARRQQLSETQLAELFDPPVERRELVRHYTMSSEDVAAAWRCRGDHNRLGYALTLCMLRHPGRVLRAGERPPPAMVEFVAEQVGAMPGTMDEYVMAERSRQRHAIECQEHLGLRPFGRRAGAELLDALLPQAIESDKLASLAGLVMQTCRDRRIVGAVIPTTSLPSAPYSASSSRREFPTSSTAGSTALASHRIIPRWNP